MKLSNYPLSLTEVEFRVSTNVLPKSINSMRRHFFKIFEEEDRQRGAPYMVKSREIREDFHIQSKPGQKPNLISGEIHVTDGNLLSLLGISPTSPEENLSVGVSVSTKIDVDILPPIFEKPPLAPSRVDWDEIPSEKEEVIKEVEVETECENGIEAGDEAGVLPANPEPARTTERRVVRKRVVRKKVAVRKQPELITPTQKSSLPDSFQTPTQRTSLEQGTLRDFVKNNPNCTVEEASKYFSHREIQKQINRGRIFSRHGRLSL